MTFRDDFYPESRFGGFADCDGTVAFFARINALIRPEFHVLDVGCGRGAAATDSSDFRRSLRTLRGKVARVVGIDVDPVGADNPFVDEFRLIEGPTWPVEDASFDLLLSDYVLEHIDDPEAFFAECRRALRPGGTLCLRTSNARSYVALAARLIPNRFHARITSVAQAKRQEQDVFPTRFRCNTPGRIRRTLRRHGFDGVVYGFDADPSYLNFSRMAYRLGVWHQKFAPRALAPAIFVFARSGG